jgi:hypothetical protein
VNKVTPSVISSPGSASTTLNAGEPDTATVIGNATSGRPTGTVSFFICGPLASAAGCPTGGQQIGGPVTLQPAGTDTSTASSPTFKPTSAGTWCFRAEYSGDASYGAATSPSGSGECFTVPEPGHPSATISSPHPSAIYGLGQTVDASYSCAEASGGPGMAACTGNAANGSPINTSTLGPHTFSVTALSQDGLSTTVSTGYTVAAPPVVSIKSPADGASYTRGQSVPVTVSCSEGKFGTGLSSFCLGPTSINTMKVGTFAYTVTVTSTDGLRTSRTVHYRVVLPSNQFTVSNLRGHNHGRVTLTAALPGRGQVKLVEKASRSGLRPPRPGTFVFASLHIAVPGKKRVQLDVMPGPRGKTLLQLHRSARINVLVTYTPTYGMSRTITFRRVRVTR